ncbi:MAG: hypothetical protein KAH57_02165, partial [Thermoplasmata archaeon]|nr:hypothetical protein [Thermoplasmata archaeon]
MDEAINNNDLPMDPEYLETLNVFEEMGIESYHLRLLSIQNPVSYKNIQFTINRKLLEGESIENINIFLKEKTEDLDEDQIFSQPMLLGSPLEEEGIYDLETKENVITSANDDDISDMDEESIDNIDNMPNKADNTSYYDEID